MLKRSDPPIAHPARASGSDSLADLVGRARTEAGDWFAAEVALYRTIGTEKANAYKIPVAMFVAALFLAHAALLALVATLFVGLAELMNPALAGLVSALLLAGAAALLVKLGLGRLKAGIE